MTSQERNAWLADCPVLHVVEHPNETATVRASSRNYSCFRSLIPRSSSMRQLAILSHRTTQGMRVAFRLGVF